MCSLTLVNDYRLSEIDIFLKNLLKFVLGFVFSMLLDFVSELFYYTELFFFNL